MKWKNDDNKQERLEKARKDLEFAFGKHVISYALRNSDIDYYEGTEALIDTIGEMLATVVVAVALADKEDREAFAIRVDKVSTSLKQHAHKQFEKYNKHEDEEPTDL